MSNDTARLAREWATSTSPRGDAKTLAAIEHIMATTPEPTMADVEWDDEKHLGAGATDTNGKVWVMSQDDGDYINCIGLDLSTCGVLAEELTPNGKRYELVEVEKHRDYSAKTMDEYRLAERADMVGMWAGYNRHEAGGEPTDFVIITGEENEAGRVPCYNPGAPTPHAWAPDAWMLTPRFDIPRAWRTDGNPVLHEVTVAEAPAHPETLTTVEDYANAPVGTIAAVDFFLPLVKLSRGFWASSMGENYSDEDIAGALRKVLRRGWGE